MADWDPAVNEIFQQAIEAGSASERAAVLDRSYGDDAEFRRKVEALLFIHDRAGSFLEHLSPGVMAARAVTGSEGGTQPFVEPGGSSVRIDEETEAFDQSSSSRDNPISRPLTEGPGTRIGPYKLLQQIGEGGMGVVYMAEQEHPVRRKVALKIIKAGMDTAQVVARFEAERQALALMDHPNIAKVLDAGATDSGRPFFRRRDATAAGPGNREAAAQVLRHWQKDPDLAGIRDDKELARLPEGERAAFKRLWDDVNQLLAEVSGGK